MYGKLRVFRNIDLHGKVEFVWKFLFVLFLDEAKEKEI